MQKLPDAKDCMLTKAETSSGSSNFVNLNHPRWWLLVVLNIFFVIAGQTSAILLNRFYYDQGGSNIFMATLIQAAGFPILFIPLILLPFSDTSSTLNLLSNKRILLIYIALGVLYAGENVLYSLGLLYLSPCTNSLISATQLTFNTIFSLFINAQKFTPLIVNSLVVVSLSVALLAINDNPNPPLGIGKWGYTIGFLCAICASVVYSLLLSVTQLAFQKTLKKETFGVVLEMQIYTSVFASIVSIAGLAATGQWRTVGEEMSEFKAGEASYFMTLVWAAISWQLCSVGVVGLVFLVSSLFSNVTSTVALTVVPLASVAVFKDKMNGVNLVAAVQAIWGFGSYLYQNYLEENRTGHSERHKDATVISRSP